MRISSSVCGKTCDKKMIPDLTESIFLFSLPQPTVADVLHCVFHRGKDLNEPDRRQVGADPLETDFNPFLFCHPAERNECNTRFGHRSHSYDPSEIFTIKKTFQTDIFLHCDPSILLSIWTTTSSCSF